MNTIWNTTAERPEFSPLRGDVSADAAVIGGGLCGVLTAYMLKKKGFDVVLLEADLIGRGQSSATTAKITVAQGLTYSRLEDALGEEFSRAFALISAAAIEEYDDLIKRENIDCEFERIPAYLYAVHGERLINKEIAAARRAGLNVKPADVSKLEIPAYAAAEFPSQAQFHPLKFIYALANRLKIYEKTRVEKVENGKLVTNGGLVSAKYIVCATNFPALGTLRGGYFAKLHREVAHAVSLSATSSLDGMYVGVDGGYNYRSFGDHIIVSGESHVSGLGVGGAYEKLISSAKKIFPDAKEELSWSAEDSVTLDGIPYIGKYNSRSSSVYTAAGFGKWGMTASMSAAVTVTDLICGKKTPASVLFDPSRKTLRASAEEFSAMSARTAKGISSRYFKVPERELSEIGKNDGGIVKYLGRKAGAYRDEDGKIYLVDPKCPHLGCELSWNGDDRTWDCPCHGSRFTFEGKMITGPADASISIKKI